MRRKKEKEKEEEKGRQPPGRGQDHQTFRRGEDHRSRHNQLRRPCLDQTNNRGRWWKGNNAAGTLQL